MDKCAELEQENSKLRVLSNKNTTPDLLGLFALLKTRDSAKMDIDDFTFFANRYGYNILYGKLAVGNSTSKVDLLKCYPQSQENDTYLSYVSTLLQAVSNNKISS